jgi:cysteine-rich repeat protein
MNLDGGGWTLIAVVSDDGQSTWTGENFMLWQEGTAVGAVTNLFSDYASALRSVLLIEDLLFIHKPSGEWGAYRGIGDGLSPTTEIFSPSAPAWCSDQVETPSVPMTAGSLVSNEGLCSTDLFLLQENQENPGGCGQSQVAYGPAWWVAAEGEPCDESDMEPSPLSGLGMSPATLSEEDSDLGFGAVLELNQGNPEQGQNAMWVLVRSGLCGDGIVSGSETCDDGGQESGDGCSDLCLIEEL